MIADKECTPAVRSYGDFASAGKPCSKIAANSKKLRAA